MLHHSAAPQCCTSCQSHLQAHLHTVPCRAQGLALAGINAAAAAASHTCMLIFATLATGLQIMKLWLALALLLPLLAA